MKQIIKFLFLFAFSSTLHAQQQFTIKLNTNVEQTKDNAEITVYRPHDHNTGRAVLALPGGAYSHLALGHEGHEWADFFNQKGITYVVLKYRMPNGNKDIPINDALEAMKILRDSADVWNINPYDIGIMGSSAGGHLASTIATCAPFTLRPNFQILFYPVISMQEKKTHKGSMQSLLGPNPSIEEQKKYSNENNVIRHLTPPAIMLLLLFPLLIIV